MILETQTLNWPDEAACAATAQALARQPETRLACLALHGPLGAGKTTFVRHLLRALGVEGRIKSPSYAIVEPYELTDATGALTNVWHFDFYRFGDPREWEDAGFRELFASPGLKLVEWPERAAGLMPTPDLDVQLEPALDASRRVVLQARTPRGARLLQAAQPGALTLAP